MIEAFEIGISLALADGLPEGMAKVQHDLAVVTRAMDAGALSVEQLQRTGEAALTVMRSVDEDTGLVGAAGGTAGAAGRFAVDSAVSSGPDGRNAGILPASGDPVSAPVQAPATSVTVTQARPAAEAAYGARSGQADMARQAPLPAIDVPLRLDAVARAARPDRSAIGQAVVSLTVPGPAEGWHTMEQASPAEPDSEPRAVSRLNRLRLDEYGGGFGVIDATRADTDAAASGAPGAAAGGRGSEPSAPVAALVVDRRVRAPAESGRAPVGGLAGMDDLDAARSAPEAAPAPMHGDVLLDGVLVGRWLSRLLDREAGRSTAGPTGFDARRNALLPGATVGG